MSWWPEHWGMHNVFSDLGYTLSGKINKYLVDLNKTPDELWKSIAHNKRRNIKKALKEGVEVVKTRSQEGLLSFYQMLSASAKRHGFAAYPLLGFEAIWKIYKPEELSTVFLARWRSKNIAGVFILIHGRTVHALAAGSLSEGWKIRPNDLLHWKVMEWACRNGYSKYHMGLVSEPPPTVARAGVWRWKKEWKGNLERVQLFDKLFLPRYKLVLKAKELLERGYTHFRQLK